MFTNEKPQDWLLSRINVRAKDYPPKDKGNYPPNSAAFDQLKRAIKKHGMLTPVFIDTEEVCVSGHYRLWAAESLEMKKVPIVVVTGATWEKKLESCLEWFAQCA